MQYAVCLRIEHMHICLELFGCLCVLAYLMKECIKYTEGWCKHTQTIHPPNCTSGAGPTPATTCLVRWIIMHCILNRGTSKPRSRISGAMKRSAPTRIVRLSGSTYLWLTTDSRMTSGTLCISLYLFVAYPQWPRTACRPALSLSPLQDYTGGSETGSHHFGSPYIQTPNPETQWQIDWTMLLCASRVVSLLQGHRPRSTISVSPGLDCDGNRTISIALQFFVRHRSQSNRLIAPHELFRSLS